MAYLPVNLCGHKHRNVAVLGALSRAFIMCHFWNKTKRKKLNWLLRGPFHRNWWLQNIPLLFVDDVRDYQPRDKEVSHKVTRPLSVSEVLAHSSMKPGVPHETDSKIAPFSQ